MDDGAGRAPRHPLPLALGRSDGAAKARSSVEAGIGESVPATCFPTESALASSWDVDLVREVAGAIGAEARAHGVHVVLGPGVNLKRSPLAGRNFEYFSEDPVLTGKLAAAFVRGLQERGVGASVKHFVANEHETARMSADSVLDERTLHELYLLPFEIAVREARPWTIMAAYNRVNGTYCAESRFLLHEVLAEAWGYDGVVVSDWLAVNDRAAVVRTLLELVARATASAEGPRPELDPEAHHRLARRAAAESIVLLKNDGDLLPLEGAARADVALLGAFAKAPRYQGAGSSEVVPTQLDTLHDELASLLGPEASLAYAPGYGEDEAPDAALLREAQEVAERAQVAIVVVGLPESFETEGVDRRHLDLPPAHEALVEAVLAVQPRVCVVVMNGAAVSMPWASRVPAILEAWLGGQGGGGAIADVLLGRVNPSGKLVESFPVRLVDAPAELSFPGDGDGRTYFTERLFTGYRWYDARRLEPLFPFGHGLSYTSFEYSDLRADPPAFDAEDGLTVTVSVRNTGARAGAEVVQLYVRERAPRLRRPDKELKAFAKLSLEPGEQREVRLRLERRDFASYDPRLGGWRTDAGTFDLLVGASSRDLRLEQTVTLEGASATRIPFDRLTPLRAWLEHPLGRELLEPALAGTPTLADADGSPMMQAFVSELPIAKLVMLGALGEDALAEAIARVNGVAAG